MAVYVSQCRLYITMDDEDGNMWPHKTARTGSSIPECKCLTLAIFYTHVPKNKLLNSFRQV